MAHPKRSIESSAAVIHLTAEEVERLTAADTSPEARETITARLADTYLAARFEPHHAVIAEQVFRLLVRDTEVRVRAMLAEQLKHSKILPRDIVLTMVRDVKEVALPMLKYSEVLTDDDLIALVQATDETPRHVAMSERQSVSEQVVGALLGKGKKEVAGALLNNDGAQLGESALNMIFERFSRQKSVMAQLAKRPALPLSVAEKVITVVSKAVAEQMKEKYRLGDELKPVEERTRERTTLALLKHNPTPYEVEKLVAQLEEHKRLTPSLIFTGLCEGHMLFFEYALARLSGLPAENVRTLINDRGNLGFRALYNKSGLPAGMFSAVRMLLSVVQGLIDTTDVRRGPAFGNQVVEKLLASAGEEPVENLSYIIALVRKSMQ